MADLNILTSNLGTYEGTDLLTNSKSIIKAINELYVNQQILFTTTSNLFKKYKLELGDLTEDSELRDSYIRLKFNNVFDGFVKLQNTLNESIEQNTLNTSAQITEIKNMIGDLENDENIKDVFLTLGWNNVYDALLDVNAKLDAFKTATTTNASAITNSIITSIDSLKKIVGDTDISDRYRVEFDKIHFANILAAIVELNNIIGYNTAAKEEFIQTDFENMIEAIIDTYNQTVQNSELLEEINNAETQQSAIVAAKMERYAKNLEEVSNTITKLSHDLLALEQSQQLQDDYIATGYENLERSLKKLADSNDNIAKMIGTMSENADEQNDFDVAGYTSMTEGISILSKSVNEMINILGNVENDDELKQNWTLQGYENVISAVIDINTLLGNLATNNVLKASFRRLGFGNVAEGMVQLSDSLEHQIISISELRSEILHHKVDPEAHSEIIPSFLMHHPNKSYVLGERVFMKNLPNYVCLECIREGQTDKERPTELDSEWITT